MSMTRTCCWPESLGCGFWRSEQHEVVAVVEPGLVKDILHVGCGGCRGDLEGPGYLVVGDDPLADQVKDFLLTGREPGLPGVGIGRQPASEHFDHRVCAPEAIPVVSNENHSGDCDEGG